MKAFKIACITLIALPLAACGNMDIRPASQAPRPYTAAHNSDVGDCQYRDSRQHGKVVRCESEAGAITLE